MYYAVQRGESGRPAGGDHDLGELWDLQRNSSDRGDGAIGQVHRTYLRADWGDRATIRHFYRDDTAVGGDNE